MGIEILNPEWKKRKKRQAGALLVAALAIQTVGAQKFDTNIAGEVVAAMSDGSGADATQNYAFNGEVQAANNFWKLNPDYASVIDSLQIEQYKKDYLKFVAEGVGQVVNAGYAINPQVMFVQAPHETSYGTDWIARENNEHFGAQGAGRSGPTTEYEDGSYQPRNISFRDFSDAGPYASFFNYAEVITNRRSDIYWDSVHCGVADSSKYVDGLLSRMDEGCDIVIQQGQWDPLFPDNDVTLSYATDPKYKDKTMNMIEFLRADEIFIPQS